MVWSALLPVISFVMSLIDVRVTASKCAAVTMVISMGDKRNDRAINPIIR
jgi:hypothetical protein